MLEEIQINILLPKKLKFDNHIEKVNNVLGKKLTT